MACFLHPSCMLVTQNAKAYKVLLCAFPCICSQNPLLYMAATRVPLALAHGLALRAVDFEHPFASSALVHAAAVLVNALLRTYQLRAFHRWLRDSARKKGVSATAASSSGQASTEGAEQQLAKAKVE